MKIIGITLFITVLSGGSNLYAEEKLIKRAPSQSIQTCQESMDTAVRSTKAKKYKYLSTSITPIGAEGLAQVTGYAQINMETDMGVPYFILVSATCKPQEGSQSFSIEDMVNAQDDNLHISKPFAHVITKLIH